MEPLYSTCMVNGQCPDGNNKLSSNWSGKSIQLSKLSKVMSQWCDECLVSNLIWIR